MELNLTTWPEVEAYLESSKAIIIPIGSTEQHGPTGLIGTDALCAEALANKCGALGGGLVTPVFAVGAAEHHMGFAGTMTLTPDTMTAVLADWLSSLMRHGFAKFFFINGHGGNISVLNRAFKSFRSEGIGDSGMRPDCVLRNWWMMPGVEALRKELFGDADGAHATASEISLTHYLFPETRRQRTLTPRVAPLGPIRDAADYRRRFPDGRIGSDPSLASPEHGRRLFDRAAKELASDYRQFAGAAA